MDKKFASAEESDDDAEEAEMSVLSTFEQNETLRWAFVRKWRTTKEVTALMSANILASYNNVQKRNDRYHSEFSGAFRYRSFEHSGTGVPTSSTTMVK